VPSATNRDLIHEEIDVNEWDPNHKSSNNSDPAEPNPLDQLESKYQSSCEQSLLSQSYRELPDDSIYFSENVHNNDDVDSVPLNLQKSRVQYFSAKGLSSLKLADQQFNSHNLNESIRDAVSSIRSGSYMLFPQATTADEHSHPADHRVDDLADGENLEEEELFDLTPADKSAISKKIEQFTSRLAISSKEKSSPAVKRQQYKQELQAFQCRNSSRLSLMEIDTLFPSNLTSIFPKSRSHCLKDSKVFEARIGDHYSFLPLHLIDWQPEVSFSKLKSTPPSNFDLAFEIFWYLKRDELANSEYLQKLLDARQSAQVDWIKMAGFARVSNSFPCKKSKQPSFVRPIIKSNGSETDDAVKFMAKVILAKICAKKLATYSDLVISDLDALLEAMGLGYFVELDHQPSKWFGDCFTVFPDEKIFWLKNRTTSDRFDLAEWVMLGGREIVSLKESWDVRQGRFFARTVNKLVSRHLVAGVGYENRLHIGLRLSPGTDCDNFVRLQPDVVPDPKANKLTVQASNKATIEVAAGESLTIHVQESTQLDLYCSLYSSSLCLQHSPAITLLL